MTLPDVRALVAERQRYDDWLSALDARRDETPARVFDRVHADYLARRDAVIDGLHAHVGSLESLVQNLSDRLQQVEAQLAEREDARAEGILRTAVGEFDSEQWETTRRDVEASIAQLEQDRQGLLAESDDVRSLLASARPLAATAESEPEPLVVPSAPDVQQELVSANVASAIAHADPAAVEHTIDLDDAGEFTPAAEVLMPEPHQADAATPAAPVFDASSDVGDSNDETLDITDPFLAAMRRNEEAAADIESAFASAESAEQDSFSPTAFATATNEAHPFASDAQRVVPSQQDREADAAIDALGEQSLSQGRDALDDIDVFGESTTARRATGEQAAPVQDASAFGAPPRTVSPFPSAPATPAPARDVFDDLAFLRSITETPADSATPSTNTPRAGGTTDQAKTLRCTECGTMNFPTEWYCERCGGELAAF
ncbi:MAG: hypothetical protein ACO1Q7_01240 [Gemmatimonas sp.]